MRNSLLCRLGRGGGDFLKVVSALAFLGPVFVVKVIAVEVVFRFAQAAVEDFVLVRLGRVEIEVVPGESKRRKRLTAALGALARNDELPVVFVVDDIAMWAVKRPTASPARKVKRLAAQRVAAIRAVLREFSGAEVNDFAYQHSVACQSVGNAVGFDFDFPIGRLAVVAVVAIVVVVARDAVIATFRAARRAHSGVVDFPGLAVGFVILAPAMLALPFLPFPVFALIGEFQNPVAFRAYAACAAKVVRPFEVVNIRFHCYSPSVF